MNRITDNKAITEHLKHPSPHYKVPLSAFTFAMLAALLFGVLYTALPETITIGPDWLPLVIEVIIITPIVIARIARRPNILSIHTRAITHFTLRNHTSTYYWYYVTYCNPTTTTSNSG